MKIYTGVGSRTITDYEVKKIHDIGRYMGRNGFTLRSGGALGSDSAFHDGSLSSKRSPLSEIYLAKDKKGLLPDAKYYSPFYEKWDNYHIAEDMAKDIHPAWDRCSVWAKRLHTRNIYQVLGKNIDNPSHILLYCADESDSGNVSGGTRTAVVLAREYSIPTVNIRKRGWQKKVLNALGDII